MLRSIPLLLSLSASGIAATPTVDSSNFDRLHALMQPTAEETRWLKIPWRTSLWQARIDNVTSEAQVLLDQILYEDSR